MSEYVYKSSTTTVPAKDNSGLILGVGIVILAIVFGALFLYFNVSESNRAIDATNAQTEAQIEAARSAAQIEAMRSAQEPVIIDRPVIMEVEKPVVIEKEVIREVPAPAPAPTDDGL